MLEPGIYEECPMCHGDSGDPDDPITGFPCAWCDSLGLVPHECPTDEEVAA